MMSHDEENIMIILSSPSGVGKTTLTKKFSKNIKISSFQFLILHDHQDLMKLKELTTILLLKKNLKL